jgi:hypothetical protein
MERNKRLGYLLVALVVTLACVPTLPVVAPLPTQPVGAVKTIIAATYDAASTGTAQQITPSSTPVDTLTPSLTSTITPTGTATVIFHFYTPTLRPTATKLPGSGGGGGGGGGSGGGGGVTHIYACKIESTTPPNGSVYPPGMPFTTIWHVTNIGYVWDDKSVDYLYRGGASLSDPGQLLLTPVAGYNLYDLPSDVKSGKSVDLVVKMLAPTTPGKYSTTWSLRIGDQYFCTLKLTISVQ